MGAVSGSVLMSFGERLVVDVEDRAGVGYAPRWLIVT